jgi:hypothetical protein
LFVIENFQLTPNESRKTFQASLTEQQRNMLSETQEMRRQRRNEFRNTTSEEQKQQMRQSRENTYQELIMRKLFNL